MNVFPKFGLAGALRLAILCCGMLFGAASLQAQSGSASFDTYQWLSGPDASTALSSQIEVIEQTLITAPPPNTVPLKMKLEVYGGIRSSIQDGSSVSEAVLFNYYRFAPTPSTDVPPTPGMGQAEWQIIYDDMIELLTI